MFFFNDNREGYSIILQLLNTTLNFTKTCKIICISEIITLRQIHLLLFNVDYYLTSTMQKPTCCLLTTRIATTTKVNPVPEFFLWVAWLLILLWQINLLINLTFLGSVTLYSLDYAIGPLLPHLPAPAVLPFTIIATIKIKILAMFFNHLPFVKG